MKLEAHPVIAAECWVTSSGLNPAVSSISATAQFWNQFFFFKRRAFFPGMISESSALKSSLLFGLCVQVYRALTHSPVCRPVASKHKCTCSLPKWKIIICCFWRIPHHLTFPVADKPLRSHISDLHPVESLSLNNKTHAMQKWHRGSEWRLTVNIVFVRVSGVSVSLTLLDFTTGFYESTSHTRAHTLKDGFVAVAWPDIYRTSSCTNTFRLWVNFIMFLHNNLQTFRCFLCVYPHIY